MARRITRRQALITGLTVAGGAVAIPVLSRSALGAEADLTGIGALVEPGELPWDAAKTIVAETALPMIPAATFDARSFGANGNGSTDNTSAFRRAIDACSAAGGGHVIVPSGTYVTGAIRLKNNVDLHLNSGAVLKFSGDASKFPTVLTRYEGIECMNRSPMIYALGQHDISVTGSGTLDDNIAIKSGRDADGRRVNVPCQNIVVFGCRMNGNWGAITCGSELTGGIRNVYAYKCTLVGVTKFALYVKSNTRRGGFAENVNLDSFSGTLDRSVAFVTSTYNSQTGNFPPRFGPIAITNSSCTHAGRQAFNVSGLSISHIRGFAVRNGTFDGVVDTTNTFNFVDNLSLVNVTINGKQIGDPPPAGRRFEAENARISQGIVESNHAGFSGTGFVNYDNVTGSFVEWTVDAAQAGAATLGIRFANGSTASRPMDIAINGAVVAAGLSFPVTGAWTTWQTRTLTATLAAGVNTIRATATTASGGPNVDYLEVSPMRTSSSVSIHRSCNGASAALPTRVLEPNTFTSIVGTPPLRRNDITRIGALPLPGIFSCMMWVKVVVACSERGMNMEYANRHVSPRLIVRTFPPERIPLTSLRCRSGEVSRWTMCMSNRKSSPCT